MRRSRITSCGVLTCGLILVAGAVTGPPSAGASLPANTVSALQSTVQSVESATSTAVAQATTPPPAAPAASAAAAPPTDPLAPLTSLPVSIAVPITARANEIGSTLLPGRDSGTGTNTTTQSSPLANVDAPVNVCSLSIGLLAGSSSSCSTASVGLNQAGAIGTFNVPISVRDNAIGLLGQAAAALGLRP